MINIYKASAGSGKTFQLAYEYIKLLFQKLETARFPHKHIVAVTFTNKATEEMKQRIMKEIYLLTFVTTSNQKSLYADFLRKELNLTNEQIEAKARYLITSILEDYSSFNISTIDKFFQKILRSFTREIGVNNNYLLMLDSEKLLSKAVDRLFDKLSDDSELFNWILNFSQEKIDNGDRWDTRRDIAKLGGQLFNESYQKSYNEESDSIDDFFADKKNLTAAKKKLNEIKSDFEERVAAVAQEGLELVKNCGLELVDFSGGSRTFMLKLVPLAAGNIDFLTKTFIDVSENEAKSYAASSKNKDRIISLYNSGLQKVLRELVRLLAVESDELIKYRTACAILKNFSEFGILGELKKTIGEVLEEENSLHISSSNDFITQITEGADAPFIYEKVGVAIDNYMIDEFQDTSEFQWNNFKPLIEETVARDNVNMLVGDVKQSIYRFRNSDWSLLHSTVEEQLSGNVFTKKTNFRSSKQVVEFNNKFFDSFKIRDFGNDTLNGVVRSVFDDVEQELPNDPKNGFVKIASFDKEKVDVLDLMVAEIKDLTEKKKVKFSDITILTRANADAVKAAQKLLDLDIPVISDEALRLTQSAEVQTIILVLRWLQNTMKDEKSIYFFINEHYTIEEQQELEKLLGLPLFDITERIIHISNFNKDERGSIAAYLQSFQDEVLKFATSTSNDIKSFIEYWDEWGGKVCLSAPIVQNAISVMTIHKSKGLEFDVVLMPFFSFRFKKNISDYVWAKLPKEFDEKLSKIPFPVKCSESSLKCTAFFDEYLEEERLSYIDAINMAYVATTRAKSGMFIWLDEQPDSNSVAEVLLDFIKSGALLEHKHDSEGTLNVYTYGADDALICKEEVDVSEKVYTEYNTVDDFLNIDIRFRSDAADNLTLKESGGLSNRRLGLLLHQIISNSNSFEDVKNELELLLKREQINEDVYNKNVDLFNRLFAMPEMKEWFMGDYQVFNESEIIVPNNSPKRPDRIMIHGDKAIVIDYKFGEKSPKYQKQINYYKDLLKTMGYSPEGYLVYVSLLEIE